MRPACGREGSVEEEELLLEGEYGGAIVWSEARRGEADEEEGEDEGMRCRSGVGLQGCERQ